MQNSLKNCSSRVEGVGRTEIGEGGSHKLEHLLVSRFLRFAAEQTGCWQPAGAAAVLCSIICSIKIGIPLPRSHRAFRSICFLGLKVVITTGTAVSQRTSVHFLHRSLFHFIVLTSHVHHQETMSIKRETKMKWNKKKKNQRKSSNFKWRKGKLNVNNKKK